MYRVNNLGPEIPNDPPLQEQLAVTGYDPAITFANPAIWLLGNTSPKELAKLQNTSYLFLEDSNERRKQATAQRDVLISQTIDNANVTGSHPPALSTPEGTVIWTELSKAVRNYDVEVPADKLAKLFDMPDPEAQPSFTTLLEAEQMVQSLVTPARREHELYNLLNKTAVRMKRRSAIAICATGVIGGALVNTGTTIDMHADEASANARLATSHTETSQTPEHILATEAHASILTVSGIGLLACAVVGVSMMNRRIQSKARRILKHSQRNN